ncbi:hypothetical protein G4W71_10870 [Clostridium botulinum]|uniref:hypothetical protein n=1 Tax=Clostridium botulinum TaxID=1491 RepID=UPI001788B102|nr:hypothetical protein [Clostridium botulinum]MBE1304523.1 hypothetical protein [Clostridium botulinum]
MDKNIIMVTVIASIAVSTITVTTINMIINYKFLKKVNKITNEFMEEVKVITLDALKAIKYRC